MNDLLAGRYRLGAPLGRGGMGMVYEAVQEPLGRRVAVKLLDPRLAEDREQLERFRREAEIVAALGHPNIVQVTDFQYDVQPPFLVMELLRGESLGGLIDRQTALPASRVAFIAAQALSALAAAHRAGVVHRDIKPDNLFLLADAAVPDTLKVLDFGIAKMSDVGQAKLTGTGAMLGTPAFMAPEQARGAADVDARADLYALGATMYQALTGRLPHEAASVPALLFAIVEKTPAPLGELRPDLPRDFVAVVERAMSKDRSARFPNADAMRSALAPWSGLPASTMPPPISGTEATVASGKVEPRTATPIVLNRTPAPAEATSPQTTKSGATFPLLATILVSVAMICIAGVYVATKLTPHTTPAAATASPSPSPSPSATPTPSPSPSPIPSPSPSLSPTPSPSLSPTPTPLASAVPAPKLKRYGGKQGFASFYDFSTCDACDKESFKNDMGMQVAAISRCFAASEHEPPIHENPDFEFSVSGSGAISTLSDRDGSPKLYACLEKLVTSMRMTMTSSTAGSFRMGFRGECTPGWTNHCD